MSPARLTLPAPGPALPAPTPVEVVRGAVGAALGLALTLGALWGAARLFGLEGLAGGATGLALLAPLAASAVLIFAAPASPMAQPWSVVAGNGLAALAAFGLVQLGLPLAVTLGLAVLVAMAAMASARCLHPPGGAVAVAVVLAASLGLKASLGWLVVAVALGSALLVGFGLVFHWALAGRSAVVTGPDAALPDQDAFSPAPPSPLALAAALGQLRQDEALGEAEIARLSGLAEALAPHAGLTAEQIMTTDPASLDPQADWRAMAAAFVAQGCSALPVVDAQNRYLGLVPIPVILRPGAQGLTARHLMQSGLATTRRQTVLAHLLPPLLQGGQPCLPVLDEDDSLCGLITRSDIVAALVLAASDQPAPDQMAPVQATALAQVKAYSQNGASDA